MTTTPLPTATHADYLTQLPQPIQAALVQICREALGMDAGEKGHAAGIFAAVALHFAQREITPQNDAFIPGTLMVSALGVILRVAHDQTLSTTTEETT